jgi:hypothetical protein
MLVAGTTAEAKKIAPAASTVDAIRIERVIMGFLHRIASRGAGY